MILRLHLLLVAIVLLQLSFCAVIREKRSTDRIESLRNLLSSIPHVDSRKVNKFIDLVRQMTTRNGQEAYLELLFSGTNIAKFERAQIVDMNGYMTFDDLQNIEYYLNTKLTSNQTQQIMKIIRTLNPDKSPEVWIDGTNELIVHAIHATFNVQDSCISKQTYIDFLNGKITRVQDQQQNQC